MSRVLLYADAGVWVAQTGFLTPTRRQSGGFCLWPRLPRWKRLRRVLTRSRRSGKI